MSGKKKSVMYNGGFLKLLINFPLSKKKKVISPIISPLDFK